MNWTGGALPRSRNSNAKASLTAAQKKHFAKVRGKLLNGPRSSPDLDFSVFNHAKSTDEPRTQRSPRSLEKKAREDLQTKLKNYEQIASVEHRLSSIRPRHNPHGSGSREALQPESRLGSASLRRQSPASSMEGAREDCKPSIRQQHDRVRNPDVPAETTTAEDSLATRRQELLRKQDWVGLANSKPAKIHFTKLKDRQLIGKRRRVEGTESGLLQQQVFKRRAIQNHARESSDFEGISVRIGTRDSGEHGQRSVPSHHERRSSSTFDAMLFDDDQVRTGSVRSFDRGNNQTERDLHRSPPTVLRRSPVEGTEASGSLQTSWAGFSPWSNSTHQVFKEEDTSEAAEVDVLAISRYRSNIGGSHADRAETPGSSEEKPWAGIPGLPLMFKDCPQTPIEISSESPSEGYSGNPSDDETRLEQEGLVSERSSESREYEGIQHEHDVTQLPVHKSTPAPVSFHREDELAEQRLPALPEAPAAAPERYKQPASPREGQANVFPSSKEAMKDTLSLEEMIWRNFVFGNDKEITDNEPEKPLPPQLDQIAEESSLLTEFSDTSGQTSILVQASSASVAGLLAQPTSTSPVGDGDNVLHEEAVNAVTFSRSDVAFPSSVAEPSLPTSGERSQNHVDSSLVAQASTSSSPVRTGQMPTSPSSDELAVMPRQPTFFFKKPSRYVGSPHDVPGTVRLGQGPRGRRGSTAAMAQKEKGKLDPNGQDSGKDDLVDEDDIIDA